MARKPKPAVVDRLEQGKRLFRQMLQEHGDDPVSLLWLKEHEADLIVKLSSPDLGLLTEGQLNGIHSREVRIRDTDGIPLPTKGNKKPNSE